MIEMKDRSGAEPHPGEISNGRQTLLTRFSFAGLDWDRVAGVHGAPVGRDGGFVAGYYGGNEALGLTPDIQDIACQAFMACGVFT